MASKQSLQVRELLASSQSGQSVDDRSLALEIVHVGDSTKSPVATLVSATGITLADDDYTTGSLDFSTYTNLGLLRDVIMEDHDLYWNARIIDGLRSTLTASSVLIPNSAISAVSRGGESMYEVFIDTSVNDSAFFRVSADRGILKNDSGQLKTEAPGGSHRVKITGITYRQNISSATLNGLRIYEYDPVQVTETMVWSAKTIDNTETTLDFTDSPITAAEGNDLVVMFVDSTITDATTNFLQVDYIRE